VTGWGVFAWGERRKSIESSAPAAARAGGAGSLLAPPLAGTLLSLLVRAACKNFPMSQWL